jgi:hypothetical protein
MPRATKGVLVPLTDYVALISLTQKVSTKSLMVAAAALQKQVTRDFSPVWGLPATVDAFEDLSSVPSDYYHLIVFGDPEELRGRIEADIGELPALQLIDAFEGRRLQGIHLNAFTRQPFALVAAVDDSWTVGASHELLELLADPFGNRLIAAAHPTKPDQRVKYLLEVCDPCQSVSYTVNGVRVSDFYTPEYFEPVRAGASRYSYTGALEYPLQILDGGYLSWIDPRDSGLYQLQAGETAPVLIASLMELSRSTAPLRTVVDSNPQTPRVTAASVRPAASAAAAPDAEAAVREASVGAAQRTAQALLSLAAQTPR